MARLASPRAVNGQLFARNHVRINRLCSRIAVMTENEILSAVAAHLKTFRHYRRRSDAFDNRVRAESSCKALNFSETRRRFRKFFNVDCVISAKDLRQFQTRRGTADYDTRQSARAFGNGERRQPDRSAAL